jgi:hypothetical protein
MCQRAAGWHLSASQLACEQPSDKPMPLKQHHTSRAHLRFTIRIPSWELNDPVAR